MLCVWRAACNGHNFGNLCSGGRDGGGCMLETRADFAAPLMATRREGKKGGMERVI